MIGPDELKDGPFKPCIIDETICADKERTFHFLRKEKFGNPEDFRT
jgi:hypothetical protein